MNHNVLRKILENHPHIYAYVERDGNSRFRICSLGFYDDEGIPRQYRIVDITLYVAKCLESRLDSKDRFIGQDYTTLQDICVGLITKLEMRLDYHRLQ